MNRAFEAVVASIAIALTLPQPTSAADTKSAGTIVLKAAHLFDATNGALRNGALVVVSAEKIVAVGTASVPADAEVIDLGEATLLPGFIDAHVHLASQMHESYYEDFYKEIHRFPAEQALHAASYAKRTLEAGFTTVRNVGVPIAFGSDSGVSTHGINAKEFSLMTELGMTPAAALTAATRDAAKLLGVEQEVGTLEPGKLADIVAVRGNALQDVRATERVTFVMKGGRIMMRR